MAPKDYTVNFASAFAHDDDTSCTSCEPQFQPAKKSVHFNPACHLKFYPMPSDEDKSNAWYNSSDYQRFKSDAKCVAKAASEGKVVAGEEMVFGLETATRARADLKRERRFRVWDIVVDGQWGSDAQHIADICTLASHESTNDAERAASMLQLSLVQDVAESKLSTKSCFSRLVSHSAPRCRATVSPVA